MFHQNFIKKSFFILLQCLLFSICIGQNISKKVVKEAILEWSKKAKDTIVFRRTESNLLRKEMKKLVSELGFDPVFMFGEKNEYFNENMNTRFISIPKISSKPHRHPKEADLEAKHIALYWSDLALYRWKKVASVIDSIQNLKEIPKSWQSHDDQEKDGKQVASNHILNDLLEIHDIKKYTPECASLEPMTQEKIVFPEPTTASIEEKTAIFQSKTKFPLSNDYIAESNPKIGQFNYYTDENTEGKIEIIESDSFDLGDFEMNSYALIVELSDFNQENVWHLKVNTEIDYSNSSKIITFKMPSLLEKGSLYRLRLLAIQKSIYDKINFQYQENDKAQNELMVKDAVEIWKNYFRVSKYSLVEKIKKIEAMNPQYDLEKGFFRVRLDEPFDIYEIKQYTETPEKRFSISTAFEKKQSYTSIMCNDTLFQYFQIPKITKIDTIDLQNRPLAELDHTANEMFIRDITKGFFPNYGQNLIDCERKQNYILNFGGTIDNKNFLEKDTIIGTVFTTLVTEKDFQENRKFIFPNENTYDIYATGLKERVRLIKFLQERIKARMAERAVFFHQLAVRDAKLKNQKLTKKYSDFVNDEKTYLPKRLQKMLNYDFATIKKVNISFTKRHNDSNVDVIWNITIPAKQ